MLKGSLIEYSDKIKVFGRVFDFFKNNGLHMELKLKNTREEKWKFRLAIKRELESIIGIKPDQIGLVQGLQGRAGLANFPLHC